MPSLTGQPRSEGGQEIKAEDSNQSHMQPGSIPLGHGGEAGRQLRSGEPTGQSCFV